MSPAVVEDAQQEVAVPGRPEQVTELVDRTDRPPVCDAQDGRILDLGAQELRGSLPRRP